MGGECEFWVISCFTLHEQIDSENRSGMIENKLMSKKQKEK